MSVNTDYLTESCRHPLDTFVPDPSGMPPLTDEVTFAGILASIVADSAPKTFAVMHEYGDRVDARVVGWGLAFPDGRAVAFSREGGLTLRLGAPEDCLLAFRFGSHLTPRLVWHDPAAATPDEDAEPET